MRLYEEEDYRSALTEFRRAYELQPNPATLFNIGQAHFQLRDYASAAPILQAYLAEVGTNVPESRRELVERELRDLRFRTGRIHAESNVPAAKLTVDEVVQKPSESVLVNVGRHRVRLEADGFVPFIEDVEVSGNEDVRVRGRLVPVAPNTPQAVSVADRSDQPNPSSIPPLVALGVGAAGLGVGVGFGVAALSTRRDLDTICVEKRCPVDSQDRIDGLSRNATLSTVGFVAGALGLGVAVVLYLTSRHEVRSSEVRQRGRAVVGPRGELVLTF